MSKLRWLIEHYWEPVKFGLLVVIILTLAGIALAIQWSNPHTGLLLLFISLTLCFVMIHQLTK